MSDPMIIEKVAKQDIKQVAERSSNAFADVFTEKTLLSEQQVKESKRNQHLGHRLLKEIDQLKERNPQIENIS